MRTLLVVVLGLIAFPGFGQINMSDSSAQVIGYWSKGDKQVYSVVDQNFDVNGEDTVMNREVRYMVDVTVTDSTAKSYTVEWFYHDFKINGKDPANDLFAGMFKDMKVIIKTDEMGSFSELVNWQQVRDEVKIFLKEAKKRAGDKKELEAVFKNVEKMFSSKEEITNSSLNDINQFYTYHGGRYQINQEYTGKLKSDGVPGYPVDVDVVVQMTEINEEDDNYIMRMWRSYDVKQMTDATFGLVKQMTKNVKGVEMKREDMPDVEFVDSIFSRIHGSSGWVIYSIQTKHTATGNKSKFEVREIEIQ